MLDVIESILHEKKTCFAVFDQKLQISRASKTFSRYVDLQNNRSGQNLWQILPELVGSEDQVHAILQRKTKKYVLDKIRRTGINASGCYFNLTLLPLPNEKNGQTGTGLLCLITDATAEAGSEQKMQQQKSELHMPFFKGNSGSNSGDCLVGKSPYVQEIRNFISRIDRFKKTTILIEGKTGTGKNLVARLIHQSSYGGQAPFVEINCASIPDNLLESELFGHEKGAFTNAIAAKKGLFEESKDGTLFLDEISEMPAVLQGKLLTFLESKSFRRVGGTQLYKVDSRIIAATNRDLSRAVRMKQFRQDLFYRLQVLTIKLPSLDELKEDVLVIADHFRNIYACEFKKNIHGFSSDAKEKLLNYDWPGNVREMRNVMERAVIFADGNEILPQDILLFGKAGHAKGEFLFKWPNPDMTLLEMERQIILKGLRKCNGNISKAARLLGLSLDTLRYRIRKYQIKI